MKHSITLFITALLWCVAPFVNSEASAASWRSIFKKSQEKNQTEPVEIDYSLLTLEENILIPEVGKQAPLIRDAQYKEMRRLNKAKLTDVELIRNKEVIKATLSASAIFQPNDTTLNDRADLYLRPFLQTLRIPDYYHVLLVMHSDDTGSEEYSMDLTRYRVNAVKEWFRRNGGHTEFIITYEAGALSPIDTNETMEGRAHNRRLEIYLVPGQKMIDLARQKKLDK